MQLWAKLNIQYKANLKPIKNIDIAQGFRISIENYKKLKERVKDIIIKIKPKYITYRSNFMMIKEKYIKEFCK